MCERIAELTGSADPDPGRLRASARRCVRNWPILDWLTTRRLSTVIRSSFSNDTVDALRRTAKRRTWRQRSKCWADCARRQRSRATSLRAPRPRSGVLSRFLQVRGRSLPAPASDLVGRPWASPALPSTSLSWMRRLAARRASFQSRSKPGDGSFSWEIKHNWSRCISPKLCSKSQNRTGFPNGEIIRSDFDRVFATAYGAAAGMKLKTQYRMLPAIGQLVSDTFYPEINLEHGRDIPEIEPSRASE